MTTRIHFIRHGQIDSNVTGALDTAVPGPSLNQLGLTQAEALVQTLAHVPFEAIYASTATRAQMTAAPLATALGLEPQIRDDIREISAGSLEMSIRHEDRVAYHMAIDTWGRGDLDVKLAGGTTGREVLERADRVFNEILAGPHREVAVVAHGALIAYWTAVRSGDFPEDLLMSHPPLNTGFAVVESHPGGWRCTQWMGQDIALPIQ